MENLAEQIEIAVSSALSECKKELFVSPKARGRANGKGAANPDAGELIAKVLCALQPVLISVICAAVKASNEALLQEVQKKQQAAAPPTHANHLHMQNQFHIDKLEQYSRRENMRVVGVPATAGEDTDQIVMKLGKDLGVEIQKEDISTSHRLKSKGKRGDPILVRFVRREKKQEMMQQKKKLREQKKEIYLEEDLTKMRAAMFYELRRDESVHSA